MTSLAKVIQKTLVKWKAEGVNILPGASPGNIALFESKYHVSIPADLKAYFALVGGMGGTKFWVEDSNMVSFWPLPNEQDFRAPKDCVTHVAPLPLVWRSAPDKLREFIVLGDYSMNCFVFCARLSGHTSKATEIYLYDGADPILFAQSIHDFLDKYVHLGFGVFSPNEKSPNTQTN